MSLYYVAYDRTWSLLSGRSPKWGALSREIKKLYPFCAACGRRTQLEVHHKKPYQLFPELELVVDNLMVLCREHHLTFGHLMLWESWNPEVEEMVLAYRQKVLLRPLGRDADEVKMLAALASRI